MQVLKILLYLLVSVAVYGCEQQNNTLKICLAGDVMLDRNVERLGKQIGRENLFTEIKPLLQKSDFVLINLECPIGQKSDNQNSEFHFLANPEWLRVLYDSGITHLGLANNHTFDQGVNVYNSTVSSIKQAGMTPVGIIYNQSMKPDIVNITMHGISVSIIAANLVDVYTANSQDTSSSTNYITPDSLISVVRNAHQKYPTQQIICFLHWGEEYLDFALEHQKELARELIDSGADAVVGHHSHVVQEYEFYRNKPIFYSLGNLIFDQPFPPTHTGSILEIEFSKNKIESIQNHHINTGNIIPVLTEKEIIFQN